VLAVARRKSWARTRSGLASRTRTKDFRFSVPAAPRGEADDIGDRRIAFPLDDGIDVAEWTPRQWWQEIAPWKMSKQVAPVSVSFWDLSGPAMAARGDAEMAVHLCKGVAQ
jgi:hypothetical protein